MSNTQKFKELSGQYINGLINWDDFAYPVRQMIEELEAGNTNSIERCNQYLIEEFKELLGDYEDACYSLGKYDVEAYANDMATSKQALISFVTKLLSNGNTSNRSTIDELTCVTKKVAELEQKLADMPTFYYKHSFVFSEQTLLIQERSSETDELVRSFEIENGCTLEYAKRALRIAGMDNDSSDIHIHQDLTTTMSERGIHIVVSSQDIVRAVYKV